MIYQKRLKELLYYNPETGEWTWIFNGNISIKPGDPAGGINERGRRRIMIDGKNYHSSRLAFLYMTGRWPKNEIDHINRNPSDDRWENLREATRSENNRNKNPNINNKSGYKGVFWYAKKNKWRVDISLHGKRIWLGYYENIEEAIRVRKESVEKYYGEFMNE